MRREKKNNEHHTDESWLIPYSDLLTLLLALFIVLFAMSKIDAQKYEELSQVFRSEFSNAKGFLNEGNHAVELPQKEDEEEPKEDKSDNKRELEQLQELQTKINSYISKNKLAGVLGTQLTDEGLLITILNDVFFESGSAEVKHDGQKIAKEVSEFLYTNPPHQIVISGHADDIPMHNEEFASNWELSVIRAVNFMHLVLQNDKLDPAHFSAKGYGDNHPIVPNTSDENRAKNRRVEVLILPNYEIDTTETSK